MKGRGENHVLEIGESHQNLETALAALLAEGRDSDFFRTLIDRCVPKWRSWLERKYPSLSVEDCDDCIYQAILSFEKRRRNIALPKIGEPYRYILRSIRNAALDLVKHYQQVAEAQDSLEPLHFISYSDEQTEEISKKSATVVFESLFGDFEPDQAWVVDVVQTAISSLRPALRRVIHYLLQEGLEYNSSHAPDALGMSAKTFRANKSNAYKELRLKIPEELSRRGITLNPAPVPEVIDKTTWHSPSADDESNDVE